MRSRSPEVDESGTREQLPKMLGALSGGLTVLVFVMIHDGPAAFRAWATRTFAL